MSFGQARVRPTHALQMSGHKSGNYLTKRTRELRAVTEGNYLTKRTRELRAVSEVGFATKTMSHSDKGRKMR